MSRAKNRVVLSETPATFATVVPETVVSADSLYPYCLTVGSILHHNGSMTLWSDNNTSVAGQGYVAVNPADAAKAVIAAGSMVKITSGVGSVVLPAQLSGCVQPGALFVPAHFRELQAGLLLKDSANTVTVKFEKA